MWQLGLLLLSGAAQARPAGSTTVNNTYDYIVVGGGTAGLTVASRLSEDPSVKVAVIEAGTFYELATGNQSQIPAFDFHYNGKDINDTNPLVEWGFTTTPQAGINNEVSHYTRGKTFGGCSALNYMSYARAPVSAMDMWAETVDDEAWKWESALKYYEKSLNFTPPDMSIRIANSTPSYDEEVLPSGGLLDVSFANWAQPISTWMFKAMEAVGIAPINGFASGVLNGSSYLTATINHTTGFRESSETAFLDPARSRANLILYPETLAEKIIFDGTTAKGLLVTTGNSTYALNARKEVILSAGVFQSPHLLMVSGVGPADLLSQHGIEVVADRPGVGQGMEDHVFYGVTYRVDVVTSTSLSYGNNAAVAAELFNTNQTGPLTSPGGDFGAYEKLPQELRATWSEQSQRVMAAYPKDWPEMQYLTNPSFTGDFQNVETAAVTDGYMYATLLATLVSPVSRGNVSISSPYMSDQPLINPNWLTAQEDIDMVISGFKRLRQIWNTTVMRENVNIGEEYYPGANVTTDEEIHENIKKTFNTMYHASSTCKMGKKNDTMAVLDGQGRVYGTENLRVVDMSSFPFLPPVLPLASVYMVAEKIADDIKQGR